MFLPLLLPLLITAQPTPYGTLHLEPWGEDGIRVRMAPTGVAIVSAPVQALLPSPPPNQSQGSTVQGTAALPGLVNGNIAASIDAATGLPTFSRVSDGATLMRATRVAFGAPPPFASRGAVAAEISFAGLLPGEALHGLGEHKDGLVARTSFASAWASNNNGVLTIPFALSTRGWGFLWNNAGYGSAALNASSQTWTLAAGANIDFWICTAPAGAPNAPAAILQRYTAAVGRAPPMPYSATGFWHSKNRYRNQTQLLDVARGFQANSLPLSLIVIDYLAWITLGDDSFNPACWPDVPAMVAELAALNVTPIASFYPYFNEGSQNWRAFVSGGRVAVNARTGSPRGFNGCLGGDTIYDPFNASARAALFGVFEGNYLSSGTFWMWQDCDEPGRDDKQNGQWRYAAGMDAEVGAAWPREHGRMVAEGFAARGMGASDFVTLSRSFFPGSATLGTALWSGDVEATWDSFYQQVRVAQTASMSGVVLWASDTGGYLGGNGTDPSWRELLVRWTQFSSVCPIFRWHGKRVGGEAPDACGPTNGANEPWAFGEEVLNSLRPSFELRESLRGYVAALSAEAAASGMPMLRPLALEFPGDAGAASAAGEACFMLGSQWLARPVTDLGARTADVYLPALGTGEWVNFHNASQRFKGGSVVTIAAPLEELPLFQRVASELP
jgi:alpha-D-xyloside xylohydrolase